MVKATTLIGGQEDLSGVRAGPSPWRKASKTEIPDFCTSFVWLGFGRVMLAGRLVGFPRILVEEALASTSSLDFDAELRSLP